MSKHLKRYIYLFKRLIDDDLSESTRDKYEEELDSLYYKLDDDDLEYIAENELEM